VHHTRRKDVARRLARIEGHVRGVERMIEEDKSCPDILLQIAAVREALNRVGRIVFEDHLEHCLADASKGGTEEAVRELKEAVARLI
jgi:CsoR family transcriptional regulator, copper-sensing transcriptional repressor